MTAMTITPINIEDEIRHSYMDYAMSVIIGRALPDVRDGLKPVHRRILYAMHELGNRWNSSYKKSARVVGDVIGKYHPHGDSAVYDALVRMAQDFNMRVPLVDGQGNFGSVDGDPPAAMRYTEVRMARAASDLLADIDKETVAWGPNYDDSLSEPLVMPTRIPNLLINGAEGIAVGMATKIPPHNLGEVVDAVISLIEDPDQDIFSLMRHIKGPDLPTGGFICGRRGIVDAYQTGRGSITMRAKADVEEIRKNRWAVVVTELPFQVNKARLIEKIAGLVRDKRMTEISDLRDESDRRGMRIVIELKNSAVPEVVLNQLYKMTAMQQNFGVIMLAIVANQPKIMDLKEILGHFIDFRRDVVTRRTIFELRKAQAREHILEGVVTALDNIDAVISTIRSSRTGLEARERLMDTFHLSEVQSQAILDMRLQKLTGLERDKVLADLDAVRIEIAAFKKILTDDNRLMEVIVEELQAVKEQHATPRRTEILEDTGDIDILELIADEEMVVTVTHTGYIKRTPLSEYRSQHRGGKGKRGMATKDEDFVKDVFVASTHDTFLVFTNHGRVFTLRVYEIPEAGRVGRGKAVVNLLAMGAGEKLASIVPIREFSEDQYVMFATRKGKIKRTALSLYRNVHAGGIRAVDLRDNDDLIEVKLVEAGQDVMLATAKGQSIRFTINDQVRPMGRVAQGVKGIALSDDDKVISMAVIREEAPVLTICAGGFGKQSALEDYPVQRRGGKGVITIQTTERNGDVVAVLQINEGDSIILISDGGQLIRTSTDTVRVMGRNTQGVKLITVADGESIVGVARVVDSDDEEEEGAEGAEGAEGGAESGDAEATEAPAADTDAATEEGE